MQCKKFGNVYMAHWPSIKGFLQRDTGGHLHTPRVGGGGFLKMGSQAGVGRDGRVEGAQVPRAQSGAGQAGQGGFRQKLDSSLGFSVDGGGNLVGEGRVGNGNY